MKPLAGPAIEAVRSGALTLVPERWTKVYLDWLENVHDWCISRQLWWGHRIPVWYDEEGVPIASVEPLAIGTPHPETGRPIVRQDEDVLDTWASSWLWPFSTLGWPERTRDLAHFYPTAFLSTARDIIYLWVARMVMAGYELLDHLPVEKRCPFATCYIHATVLDEHGRRMSKSLGNGIDPIEMVDRYGADAVRYSLVMLTREGQDVKLAENRFELGQRFCNKIWNAARFVLGALDGAPERAKPVALEDRWIRSRCGATLTSVSAALEQYRFHDAAQELYRFFWNDYCDWYLEVVKPRLASGTESPDRAAARFVVSEVLDVSLRMLHPFLPFLTEELWSHLPASRGPLMTSEWPEAGSLPADEAAEGDFAVVQEVVTAVRNVRSEMGVAPSAKVRLLVQTETEAAAAVLSATRALISSLAGASELSAGPAVAKPAAAASALIRGGTVFVPLEGLIDLGVERKRLSKESERLAGLIRGSEGKLASENFVSRAKPEVVEREREKLESLRGDLAKVARALRDLG
jgi:valyl-tRNA synthetase